MAKEDDKKEDEKLTPVGDGVETPEKDEKVEADSEDEKAGHTAEADANDDEEDDEGGDDSELSPERRKLREKRRQQKIRKSARIASDRRELDFLRRRNEEVERQLSQVVLRQEKAEVSSIDQRIGTLEGQIREAETIHAQAVENKDGSTATEALRVKDQLRDTLTKLKGDKEERQKTSERSETQRQTQVRNEPDPEAVRNGREWLSKNDWFDPTLNDEDSYVARALEERLAREGRYDPRDPDYWEELDRRITKRMPHLKNGKKVSESDDDIFEEDDEKPAKKPAKKNGGPRIAVGGKVRSLKPNEVYISEQRKQALIQAGVWDDEEKRERYLKSYKAYDEEARRNS